jgi:hypothetical protein
MHIKRVEVLIDGKPQSLVSGSGVAHGILPSALSFLGDLAVAEKLEKVRVCVR